MSLRDEIRWHAARLTGSEDCPPYGILKITGAETVAGRTRYTLEKPDGEFQRLYVINGPATLKAGTDYTGSVTFEIAYALCDSSASPVYGESWGAKPSSWKLWQHRPGFFMLGNYQGSGDTQRAQVRQQEVLEIWGTLDGALAQGSSQNMIVKTRDGNAWTTSGFEVTVRDNLLKSGADAIQTGKKVVASWYGDAWWVTSAECNT